MKNDQIQVRVNEDEKAAISEIAAERDIPVSQFVREAVREKIAEIRQHSQQAEDAAATV